MRVIEALKKGKDLARQVDDLKGKVSKYCADLSADESTYPDQAGQVKEWLQSIHERIKEMLRLRVAIQRTNLATVVGVELNGEMVEHTIAEWIHRRRDLANLECLSWKALTDKGLKPQAYSPSGKQEDVELAKVRRYFDPKIRDQKVELFTSEPTIIDSKLEVINAETDLIE